MAKYLSERTDAVQAIRSQGDHTEAARPGWRSRVAAGDRGDQRKAATRLTKLSSNGLRQSGPRTRSRMRSKRSTPPVAHHRPGFG
jgi:hypothetical protein